MHLVALVGSLRAGSSNARLVRAAVRRLPPGVTVDVYEGLGALPHFDPGLDEMAPPAVVDLRARVGRAQGLLVSSPEYAHGIPGSLKNALDWLVSGTALTDLPTLLVTASPGGGAHAHAALREVLTTMSARVLEASFATPLARAGVDEDGTVNAPELSAQLDVGVDALVEAAGRRR